MDMEENKEHKVVMRKMTKEEEQAKVEEQLKQEYLREQLRNAERERSALRRLCMRSKIKSGYWQV